MRSAIPFRRLVAVTLLSALGLTTPFAGADEPASRYAPPARAALESALVRVDVYDRTTRMPLPIYPDRARRWIEGVPGHEYAVRIRNVTAARILVVTSVDGVNVVSGETASPAQSGYVLGPYDSVEIAGWRKSMARTAAFYFTDLGDSYAARTGRPGNVGVIGVAVFQEKAAPEVSGNVWSWRQRFAQRDESGARAASPPEAKARADSGSDGEPAAAPAAPPAAASAEAVAPGRGEAAPAGAPGRVAPESARAMTKLGTGHGRNEDSPVTMTSFERATSAPAETLTLRYDRRENLVAMGILPPPLPPVARRDPDPFPAQLRFAPDPR